jgi:hypothetical protein
MVGQELAQRYGHYRPPSQLDQLLTTRDKGPIEKGANDGQLQYAKDLAAALRAAVTLKSLVKGARGNGSEYQRFYFS